MLNHAIQCTNRFIDSVPKAKRKEYGQFFTSKETAKFMVGLFEIPKGKEVISILDAGAGSGILTCAFIERLNQVKSVRKIEITCYENDENIQEVLNENLKYCLKHSLKKIEYRILTENYITSQYLEFNHMLMGSSNPPKYDFVIGNPPYMKISKEAPEAVSMPEVCYGAPNMYFLFASMGLFNLADQGEMVYIMPRSWTSGAYFKHFRRFLLSEGKLKNIHLFITRDKVFDREDILQETMIIKMKKTHEVLRDITITSSKSNYDFDQLTSIKVPYELIVSGIDKYVFLATNDKEVDILKKFRKFTVTLPDIGIKMRTGLTVDFRNRESLRNEEEKGSVPLFYSQHIRDGEVQFPIQKDCEYMVTSKNSLIQDNKNYLFVKRFTSKEENRRLQCGMYLAKKFPQFDKISTQNKVNFVDGVGSSLSECIVYGLYVIFNSRLFDDYYRILNGSTQVNSTEINAMPVPDLDRIEKMGFSLMKSKDFSEENCNVILEGYCG